MKKSLFIIPLLLPVLVGCGSSNNVTTSTSEVITCDDSSMKGILTYLSEAKNYSFNRYLNGIKIGNNTFTEHAIANIDDDNWSNSIVYVSDDVGTYFLRVNDENKYIASEYRNNETDLYNSSIVHSFFGTGEKFIKSLKGDETEVNVSDKAFKMEVITAFGFTESEYVIINSFAISYVNKSITFSIGVDGLKYPLTYTTTNLGDASCSQYNSHINKGGTAYTPARELDAARRLLKSNNFIRSIYDFETKKYIGDELFNEHYFVSDIYNYSTLEFYISLNYLGVDPGDPSKQLDLKGIYRGTVNGHIKNGVSNPSLMTTPFSDNPNMSEFFHYPTYLKLWEQLEFLKEDEPVNNEHYTSSGKVWSTTNVNLIRDFATNNSIDQSFDLNTFKPYKLSVDIEYFSKSEQESIVTFLYYFNYAGSSYCMPLPFKSFGKANQTTLDNVYNAYNNR